MFTYPSKATWEDDRQAKTVIIYETDTRLGTLAVLCQDCDLLDGLMAGEVWSGTERETWQIPGGMYARVFFEDELALINRACLGAGLRVVIMRDCYRTGGELTWRAATVVVPK